MGIRSAVLGYGDDGVRQKFDGYERDAETSLDFAQARYYSSIQGRFTSPDPLIASAILHDPQSWNRYSFVGNRPLIYIDPTGLQWGRSTATGEYQWFQSGVVDDGWEEVNIGQEYESVNGRVVLQAGGNWDYVRPPQEGLNVFRDSQLTNSMMKMWGGSVLLGLGLGAGAATGSVAAPDLFPMATQMAAAMLGIGNEEAGGTILSTTPSGPAGTPGMLKLSELTPTEQVRSVSNLKNLITDISANGIKEPISYVEHNGVRYIVDGHHRYAAAHHLRLSEVPAQQVSLPYKGFKTVNDLNSVPMSRFLRANRWIK